LRTSKKSQQKNTMEWVIVPLEHLNLMEQGFLQYVRNNGDVSRDYPYDPESEINFIKEHPELAHTLERSSQNGQPDKYGYISTLLVTHETGSWQPWKWKLIDRSELLKKMKK